MARQPKATAKTGAERARIFRTKVKADDERCKAYKEKDKERKRASRKSKSNTPSPGEATRRKRLNRERVRKCRQKKWHAMHAEAMTFNYVLVIPDIAKQTNKCIR